MNVGIIPSRYASTRFSGKPLTILESQTMLERVWRAATSARTLNRVIIATDDERIVAEANRIGAEVCLTSSSHISGTDRCAEVLTRLNIQPDIIVNIQGDEPLMPGTLADELVLALQTSHADVVTAITPIYSEHDLFAPSVVKVAVTEGFRAVYFSRHPIPYLRDIEPGQWLETKQHYKHIGIYAYTRDALEDFTRLPVSQLEQQEQLEQLRLLSAGKVYSCVLTHTVLVGVDTPEDADRVREILKQQK